MIFALIAEATECDFKSELEKDKPISGLMIKNPNITAKQISDIVGITKRRIESNISQMKNAGLIEREGAKKNGHWVVKKKYGGTHD